MIIGEAAARLSVELRSRHSEIAWTDIIGFRNIAVHGYFGIRWPTVWVIASEQVPALRPRIAAILATEFPGES